MKKTILLFTIIGTCILLPSCETCGIEREMTLAGSISYRFNQHPFTATGEYDGASLGEPSYRYPDGMRFVKLSDTAVTMRCGTVWGDTKTVLEIIIPGIPLDGVPDNVTFDHTSTNATVTYDGTEYNPVSASVTGWVRNVNFTPAATRCSPANQLFLCDIEIECMLAGKKLILTLSLPK